MKKGIGFAVVALALVLAGCGGSKFGIQAVSTTSVMPPAKDLTTNLKITMQADGTNPPHDIRIYVNSNSGAQLYFNISGVDKTKVSIDSSGTVSTWKIYTIHSTDKANNAIIEIPATVDGKTPFTNVNNSTNTATSFTYFGEYVMGANYAIVVCGDISLFP